MCRKDGYLAGNSALRGFMDQLTTSTTIRNYVELPMICVLGDTSSGKSSLLSALSMVELPSSHQLTTRCPILLQMTKSSTEKYRVSVQWSDKEKEGEFEAVELNNDDDDSVTLPEAILQAQKAILNLTKAEVSSDVILVNVYGPECIDLILLDLPGIAHTRGIEDSESLIEDINSLIQKYLANPRCVILAVVPANVDFHNSQVLAMTQQVDPDTKRTIPVITKPDLIDAGAEEEVIDLLLGRKMKFELGFHMCRGRGQASLDDGQSLEEGLKIESDFFASQEPWKGIEDRNLFGTENLRQKLGDLQMNMIRQTIPTVLKEIHEKQQRAFSSLVSMGNLHQTVADKRRYYQDYCQSYVADLKSSLSGKGKRANNKSAAAKLHDACADFMKVIGEGSLATVKTIVEGAHVLVTSSKGDIRGEVVHVDDDYACVDYLDKRDHTIDVLFDCIAYQAQETLEEDDVWSDGTKIYIARKNNTFDLLKRIPINRVRTDPSWLQEKIAENRTDDLACFLNVEMFKSTVSDFIEKDWKPHCVSLINRTSDIVLGAVSDSLQKSCEFERFPALHELIKKQSTHAARALLLGAEKQMQSHLEMEKFPYTQDNTLFENISSARHRCLKRELEVSLRLDQEGAVFDTAAMQSIIDGVFERNQKKSVEEHMAEDMEIVLESYGKVATKRVIDRTPMICWEVFRSVLPSIQETLWNITDKQLEETMQDSEEFAQRYKDVTVELEQMNKALTIFQSLL